MKAICIHKKYFRILKAYREHDTFKFPYSKIAWDAIQQSDYTIKIYTNEKGSKGVIVKFSSASRLAKYTTRTQELSIKLYKVSWTEQH